jgi:cytochrome P450
VTTSLLSIQDENVHSQYRKLVSFAYSMSSLKGYEPYVDEMVNRFVEVCDRYAQAKEPMNISMWCTYCKSCGHQDRKSAD